MDIMTGLSAISEALKITNKLRELDKKFDKSEFKMQISDLYMALSDAKIALADAKLELSKKDVEIDKLKSVHDSKMRTSKYKGYNFGIDESGHSIGRPFCPVCEKTKDIQIQLTRTIITGTDQCPSCKAAYSGYPWQLPPDYLETSE
ncbi:MAG: hypothetical protein COB46_14480 [Rhodospirillaceae bacterium]|nr:MAG: hypothetical protein COB46_14480 [Rhodospirillaceae bacterium]